MNSVSSLQPGDGVAPVGISAPPGCVGNVPSKIQIKLIKVSPTDILKPKNLDDMQYFGVHSVDSYICFI